MSRRTNVAFPIVFAALGILFITTILVAWNIMFTQYFVLAKEETAADLGTGYWFILAIGDLLLLMVVVIVVLFMVSGIRHVRYRHRQDTFIDSVTHELKSPLAGLRLGVDTLDRRELTRDEKTKFLTMMRDDVDRLQRFIEQLLATPATYTEIAEVARQRFGKRRAPSRSAIGRYSQTMRATAAPKFS